MSDRQQNWYRRLLDKSWQMPHPCFLPNDPAIIAGICRCNPLDIQAEGLLVMAKFETTEDSKHLFNRRLLREYCKQRKAYEGRAQAGKDSAVKRSVKGERDGQSTVTVAEASRSNDAEGQQLITHNHNHIEPKSKPKSSSRDKRESDPRFKDTHDFIKRCCEHAKVDLVWDASEAAQLSKFLKAAPALDQETIKTLIRNRFRSADPPGTRPREWIPRLSSYSTGPLDRFNKPEEAQPNGIIPHTNGAQPLNASQRRTINNLSEAQRALQRERERRQAGSDHPGSNAAGSGS